MNTDAVRTRFAPSPTGTLHIGGARTALFAYLLAKRHGGSFVLRVEDTDQAREKPGAVQNIIETLQLFGITPDEGPYIPSGQQGALTTASDFPQKGELGPYIQSQRLEIYRTYADQLIEQGHAYPCFATKEELEEMRATAMREKRPPMYDGRYRDLPKDEAQRRIQAGEPYVIRLKVPKDRTISCEDAVFGKIDFASHTIDDQVLIKSDGFPTYHFAVVIDDHLMQISHVIRGEEWIASTPKHILLYELFGWKPPVFAHVPVILNPDKTKLSKRHGAVAAIDFLKQGYDPDVLLNFIALIGWNPKTTQEQFTLQELIGAFSLSGINRASGVFDREKLAWMHAEHIKSLDLETLWQHTKPFYDQKGLLQRAANMLGASNKEDEIVQLYCKKSLTIEQTRLETYAQVGEETDYLFTHTLNYKADDLVWRTSSAKETRTYLEALDAYLSQLLPDNPSDLPHAKELETQIIAWIAERSWKNGDVLWPLRVSLTGKPRSPGPFESVWALGKEESLKRVRNALSLLS